MLAITTSTFTVWTANAFAGAGPAQPFYFASGSTETVGYLHYGLAVLLASRGSKLILRNPLSASFTIPLTLSVIVDAAAVDRVESVRQPAGWVGSAAAIVAATSFLKRDTRMQSD